MDAEGFTGELIENREHFVGSAVAQAIVHEIEGPDVFGISWSESDDRGTAVMMPPALFVAVRERQLLFAPRPLGILVVHTPPFGRTKFPRLTMAVVRILFGRTDYRPPQGVVVFGIRSILHGGSHLDHYTSSASL